MRTWTKKEDTILREIYEETAIARDALTDGHGNSRRYWAAVSHYMLKDGAERTGAACRKRHSVLTIEEAEREKGRRAGEE